MARTMIALSFQLLGAVMLELAGPEDQQHSGYLPEVPSAQDSGFVQKYFFLLLLPFTETS